MKKYAKSVFVASMASLSLVNYASAQEGTVNLYTANPVPAVEAVIGAARDGLPGVRINTITGGSGVLLRRMEAEAGQVQADIFWSSNINTLAAFQELFQPHESVHLDAIPEELHYPGNLFLASNLQILVFMVNEDRLDGRPVPTSWKDLMDPAFHGDVIVADPTNSSTGYTVFWGANQLLGDEALEALSKNLVISGSSSAVQRGVAQGEYAVGLTFEPNAYAYVDGGQDGITIVYPSEGTFMSPEYLALAKGAPAEDTARAAIDFMLTKEVQTELLLNGFRRPSRSDIEVSEYLDVPELKDINIFSIDEVEAAAYRDQFLARWQELEFSH